MLRPGTYEGLVTNGYDYHVLVPVVQWGCSCCHALCHCLCFPFSCSPCPLSAMSLSASCLSLSRSLSSVSMWKVHKTGSQET
jgi:hypothetical protein